ncbi:MAG TPA: cation-efflux pump [Firmicutes bacterium]|nr:cation-efflux pump [Bacillota bacterium]
MKNNEKIAIKVSVISIILNCLLTLIKFISGVISKSSAMISDSVHSLSDVLSTFVVIIGVKISNKKADSDHPYGHERIECVSAIILSGMLFIIGALIGINGIKNVTNSSNLVMPGVLALIASIISIISKEAMYQYTIRVSKKINSAALKADAWHHRSDALSSIGSFIGILGSRLGFKIFDPLASVIISLCIIKVSIDIFKDAIDKMVDKSCDKEVIDKVISVIEKNESVKNIDDIKTRQFGNKAYVDVEISVDENLLLKDAHKVAEEIHNSVENEINIVKHCMVHVNPYEVK